MLLADEPTGEVDSEAAEQIYNALRAFNREFGVTVIIVTHDLGVSARVDRVVGMRDGRTSIEILRRRNVQGDALNEEEYVILDKAGRLQLPQHFIDQLGLADRARVRMMTDYIGVYGEHSSTTPSVTPSEAEATP
jgi:ABC-type methionine transport system ATPase subunit